VPGVALQQAQEIALADRAAGRRLEPLALGRRRDRGGAATDQPGKPGAKAGDRRKGCKCGELRQVGLQLEHYLLDQEIAERDSAQAILTVADRVEDRLIGIPPPHLW